MGNVLPAHLQRMDARNLPQADAIHANIKIHIFIRIITILHVGIHSKINICIISRNLPQADAIHANIKIHIFIRLILILYAIIHSKLNICMKNSRKKLATSTH